MTQAFGNQPQQRSLSVRRSDVPRRVKNGLKLTGLLDQVRLGPESLSESPLAAPAPRSKVQNQDFTLARRWIRLLESRLDPSHLGPGLEYARGGQIVSLEIEAGLIRSQVQGVASKPCAVKLSLPTLEEDDWQRAIDAMAGEAIYAAKLLAHEMPPGMDELLASQNVALLPEDFDALKVQCTCETSSGGEPAQGTGPSASDDPSASEESRSSCIHAAAAGYYFGERLATDPLLALTLAGMPAEKLLARLREARSARGAGTASAHAELALPESHMDVLPLEACLEDFWRSPLGAGGFAELKGGEPFQHVPHALLRRLGPSPMSGRFPMVGLLASVYDTVAAAAKKLRDELERA